ncbi:hypothetical protein Hanom_Chr16g01510581 [Helianthus anomalus]
MPTFYKLTKPIIYVNISTIYNSISVCLSRPEALCNLKKRGHSAVINNEIYKKFG